jgi:hypothetical protein
MAVCATGLLWDRHVFALKYLPFQYVSSLVNLSYVTSKTHRQSYEQYWVFQQMMRWNDTVSQSNPLLRSSKSRLTLTATPALRLSTEEPERKRDTKRELERPDSRSAARDGIKPKPQP